MDEFLSDVLNIAVPVFAVSSMLAVGLTYTFGQIVDPLRDVRLVVLTLIASFVAVPLLAFGVIELLALDEPYEVGLILVGASAGAPFLIKLTQAADGDVAMASGVLVLLLVVTVVYLPFALPLALPGVEVDAMAIGRTLAWTMLAPLVAGLLVEARAPGWAARLRPLLGPLSTVTLLVLVATTFLLNVDGIIDIFGERAIFAALLVIGGAFLLGYGAGFLVEEPSTATRGVLGLATAQRNIAAATVVATENFSDANVLVMVVVTSLVALALLFPAAWGLSRIAAGRAPAGASRRRSARGAAHRA